MATSARNETDKADLREKVIFTYWLWPAVAVPFVILGWWGGFGAAFENGSASAFMCGAIITALGECLFENWQDGFTRLKAMMKTADKYWFAALGALVLTTAFFFLNMYFTVADKKATHSVVDWVQVLIFIVAAAYLPQARFAFVTKTPTVPGTLRSNADLGYQTGAAIRKKLGWGAHDAATVTAEVAPDEGQAAEAIPGAEGTAPEAL